MASRPVAKFLTRFSNATSGGHPPIEAATFSAAKATIGMNRQEDTFLLSPGSMVMRSGTLGAVSDRVGEIACQTK